MRSFESWLDGFCRKHRNFAIPNLMLYIVIGTLVVSILDNFTTGPNFSTMLAFIPSAIFKEGQIWRLVTFIFVPSDGNMLFLALSLYLYYFIGKTLEREWGSARFTVFYVMGLIFNIAVGVIFSFILGFGYPFPVASMYYINMSLFLAFAALYPDLQLLLMFIIPIKIKWLAWVDVALFAWSMITSAMAGYWPGVILPVIAMLNFLLFFSDAGRALFGRFKYRHSKQTVNFKKATKDMRKEKGYIHKCAVCGITDTDHPDMEFRYCSKCNGYHCYCMDHINNHVHIQ